MAAIITDQLRILNASNFVSGVQSSSNSYYAFIGLPDATSYQTDWDTSPPSPKDNLNQSNDYWDTMLAVKKVNAADDAIITFGSIQDKISFRITILP